MKQNVKFFLVFLAFVGMSVMGAKAQTVVDFGSFGASGNNLTWVLTSDSILTIYGSGDMGTDYNALPWEAYVDAISTAVIGDSVTNIGRYAFANCQNLTSVTIGNSVASIEYFAFYQCLRLPVIIIPNSVTKIEDYAFYSCHSLSSLTIPSSVVWIPPYAFWYCEQLPSIDVDANNPVYSSIDGIVYNKKQDTLVVCPGGKTGVLEIPDGVTHIGEYSFYACDFLSSITISNSVASIGYLAFQNCQYLSSVTIGNSVVSIGSYAFDLCDRLSSVICKALVPPVLGDWVFGLVPISDTIPISIPCGTYDSYSNDPEWSYFSNFMDTIYVDTTFYAASICQGDVYNDANFSNLTKDSIYYATISTGSVCDNTVCLTLSYYPSVPLTTYSAKICEGEIYNDANFTELTQAGTYYNRLKNENGCDSVICLTLTVTVGIVEANNYADLQVYPNPVKNELTIKNEELREGSVVEIFNIMGQKLLSFEPLPSLEPTIDVSCLSSGMYFLKVDNKMVKFVKE